MARVFCFHTKSLNTVLAFVSSKNHLATTFSVIRSSVEGLLKRFVVMLIPDTIKFAYVPRTEIQIHENSIIAAQRPLDMVDFSLPSANRPEEDEHVLVLEFIDNFKGKRIFPIQLRELFRPPLNKAFEKSVNDLILATSPEHHVPVNPHLHGTVGRTELSVPTWESRPSVASAIEELLSQEWYKGQLVHRQFTKGRAGQAAQVTPLLPEAVVEALKSRNIHELYIHQVAAIQSINQGKNVVVSTSTASGKSIIYQVPLLSSLLLDPTSKAIFVYPTKALAQDQQTSLRQLLSHCPGLEKVLVSTYDGDTPQESRAGGYPFDMLHASILPHEESWRSPRRQLFVIDELHYYSGLMASHVAYIIRRFRRLCSAIGNHGIRFVSCSATISDPLLHMTNLLGTQEDGAPSGPRESLIWDTVSMDSDRRPSSLSEAIKLMSFLMKRGLRVILFCKIRKVCELAMKSLRADLSSESRYDILERERRRIEQEAFNGHLLGIIATNALELGVDIGVLDTVIMLGFPMSIASFRQQAGRVGRRSRDSLTILVAESFAIDRHYVNNPSELYDQPPNDLLVDLDNKIVLEAHLQCAAHEMPLSQDDMEFFGPQLQDICNAKLRKDEDGWYHTHPNYLPYPSRHISIRGAQEEKYTVVVVKSGNRQGHGKILEEVEESRAIFEVYEGGVFMHQGITYIVQEVNHDNRTAQVIQADVNWITSPSNIEAIQTYRIREITHSSYRAYYGKIEVHVKVFGLNQRILDTGFWIDLPTSLLDLMRVKNIDAAEAIHSAEHALLNRFGLPDDVKTECKAGEKEYRVTPSQRKRPARLIFYDAIRKGGGVAVKAFDHVRDLLEKADAAIEECLCSEGCQRCVHSPACKENNEVSSKLGATLIIKTLLGRQIDPQRVPEQPEIYGLETIVAAATVRGVGIEVETAP
ncbi:P-loop containing nucleoside triphosphate hydrolase protein [Amanita rubescens]|nr:P-loop containing nucleoside triphosphate hydrolase protein [Amanita rubescens]